MISEDIKTKLKATAGITALVGTGDNARVFQDYQKQGAALPHIVIEEFDGISNEHLSGGTGIENSRVQVTAFDSTPASAYTLAKLIRDTLQGFRGLIGSQFVNGIISPSTWTRGIDKPSTPGGNDQRFYVHRDFLIAYKE